tara:strand:+ start:462 stop:800 length:339 start_codon:yes stop_codon:yes gene_type:complete
MTANNVIKFPTLNDDIGSAPPQNGEELGAYFDKNKKEYIDHICDHYSHSLYNKLGGHGFDIMDDKFITHFTYTVETLRYCLYDSMGMDHTLSGHISEMIEIIETEDELPDLD